MNTEKPILFKKRDDLPDLVVSSASMLWNHTGSWRYIRPRYQDKTPPCNQGCPAGNDIEQFLSLVSEGKYQEAFHVLTEENPFPSVCGRVCYHPCETACNRSQFDRPVAINALERFSGDHAPENHHPKKLRLSTGKKISIIGSGPAGLTAAYHSARMGHTVTVFESMPKPGGLLRYGIPEYRLPKIILEREIKHIENLGVKIECNTKIGKDISWNEIKKQDAVFVATGVHENKKLGIEGEDVQGVMGALPFLKEIALGKSVDLGPETVVIGGGNSAVDAARTALRLGSNVTIFYQRSRVEMPAFEEEILEAEKEGVKLFLLSQPVKIMVHDGELTGIQLRKTRLGEPDESGRRRPEAIPGSEFIVQATSILTAIGESANVSFLPKEVQLKWGKILIDNFGLTNHPGVFAGGDVALGDQNVSRAIGSGKAAAIAMDSFLKGAKIENFEDRIIIGQSGATSIARYMEQGQAHVKNSGVKDVVAFSEINLNYFEKCERSKIPKIKIENRGHTFQEVQHGLSEVAALSDAARCFHCGVCTMCDNCYGYCPDLAINRKQDAWGYEIDFDYCKGCGICINECPRSAMIMEDEA